MKKNDSAQEFEKMLKDKMRGLSANVDCFDKISERAFPDKSEDFSDSGLTVTGLENITGKRRRLPVLKWVSAAAALILVVGILPKTLMTSGLKDSLMNKQDKKIYRELLSEIKSETEKNSYTVTDIPLEEYIANDVLITPFYSCPFGSSDKEDMNVRLYIRTVGDVPTNQIYAVEYCGEYSESSIVAAAKSDAGFTARETARLESAEIPPADIKKSFAAASGIFLSGENDQQELSAAAGFYGTMFCKDGSEIYTVNYNVVYYQNGLTENDGYYYDIVANCSKNGISDSSYTVPENAWKCSVNYNSADAFPESSGSLFTRAELFSGADTSGNSNIFGIMPFRSDSAQNMLTADNKLELYSGASVDSKQFIAELSVPAEETLRRNTAVFFPASLGKNGLLSNVVITAGKFASHSYDSFITAENINDFIEETAKKAAAKRKVDEYIKDLEDAAKKAEDAEFAEQAVSAAESVRRAMEANQADTIQ